MNVQPEFVCPVCGGSDVVAGPTFDGMPAHAVRLATTAADQCAEPRGTIALTGCLGCGFVTNAAFDPSLLRYGPDYESTQAHSPTYRAYAVKMVDRLLDRVGRERSDGEGAVVDVGCGQGEFLAAFADRTSRPLIGFDPALDETRRCPSRATLRPEVFDPSSIDQEVSLITCKMTLEHVADPVGLLRRIAEPAARSDALVFVQVPDCRHVFERVLVTDVIYEHVNYFTEVALATACARAGLDVVDSEVTYGDQHLGVIARAADPTGQDGGVGRGAVGDAAVREAVDAFERFGSAAPERVDRLRVSISRQLAEGGNPVLWGAGSKAVSLLALTGLEDRLALAIDVNPLKIGTFLPGSGVEIAGPDDVRLHDVTDVFVMNPVYADEIAAVIRARGVSARLHLVD